MQPKLSQAFDEANRLSDDRQDELADWVLAAVKLAAADEAISKGEASFAKDGGKPASEVFARLAEKYAG